MINEVGRVYKGRGVSNFVNNNDESITATFSRYRVQWYWDSTNGAMMELTFRHELHPGDDQVLAVHAGAENVLRANVAVANRALRIEARFRVHHPTASTSAALQYQALLRCSKISTDTVATMVDGVSQMRPLWEHFISIATDPSPSLDQTKQTTSTLLSCLPSAQSLNGQQHKFGC
eukprot:TRINITY_DN4085_c0_g2_i2.p1 TRINITY_DN4085_c0_g2~~TRINITY_DN4085_c0_g2_i2.p1  ORF type:complete len:176 (-),score=21.40 TRINITY_DN4085_c0_g2_i2:131-658(-)